MRELTESELYSAHLHQRYCPSSAIDKMMHVFPCHCLLSSGQKSDQISQEHGVFEMNQSLLAVTKGDINFRTIKSLLLGTVTPWLLTYCISPI